MNSATPSEDSRPWYKEPWPWLLMAGPALAIIGCAITIYLAMTRFVDEPIYDGGTRRGLVVERAKSTPPSAVGGSAAQVGLSGDSSAAGAR